MNIFRWFENWFDENKQLLLERNITFAFSAKTQTDNPAQYVDINTEKQMAGITFWESGSCDFEILENETGKNVFWESENIKSNEKLTAFLDKGFTKLYVSVF